MAFFRLYVSIFDKLFDGLQVSVSYKLLFEAGLKVVGRSVLSLQLQT